MENIAARGYYRKVIAGETPTELEIDAAMREDMEKNSVPFPFAGPALPGNYFYFRDYDAARRHEESAARKAVFSERLQELSTAFDDLLCGSSADVERAELLEGEVLRLLQAYQAV